MSSLHEYLLRMVRRVGSKVLVVGDKGRLVSISPAGCNSVKHIEEELKSVARWSSESALGGFGFCQLLPAGD